MIYKAKVVSDNPVEDAYQKGMFSLNEFWGINWKENTPDIFIVESRKEIDLIKGKQTSDQLVGWSKNRSVYVIDFKSLETDSSYRLTPEQYKALIKHELNHLFYGIVSGGAPGPLWLREGLSIYLSGQTTLGQWEKPFEFQGFIDSDSKEENKKYAYAEGGFIVELLVQQLGKEKVIQLVRQLKKVKDLDGFKILFREILGIELEYKDINELYSK
jgi:hypothetical protein